MVAKGWTIDVPPPAAAPGPEIVVTGNGVNIESGDIADLAKGTDFGQVLLNTSVSQTFVVSNVGTDPLTVQVAPPAGTPPFIVTQTPSTPILSGQSANLVITFTPTATSVYQGSLFLFTNDANEGFFTLNTRGEGVLSSGEIDVEGNGVVIANGDVTPDVADDTDFGSVVQNTTKTNTYTINNNGTTPLNISSIALGFNSSTTFAISGTSQTLPYDIPVGGSMTFDVDYTPISLTSNSASIVINNSQTLNNPYQFAIAGLGVDAPDIQEIMFSQYYGGFHTNDKWIEIVNISQNTIPANTYYLALYDNSQAVSGTIETATPIALEAIPELAPGEVILYRNPNANTGINFAGTPISSSVGVHDTNDLLIITTSATGGYPERVDVLGFVDNSADWGSDKVLIKGACSSESAHRTFSLDNWQEILIVDVDVADADLNIELGTQRLGSTEFDGVNWSNGVADQSREVIVTGNFFRSSSDNYYL